MPHSPMPTRDSLREVRYDIRGELSRRARELEGQGRQLIRLNIGNPGAFGLTNARDACFNGITACANPDDYLYWDGVHPTTAGHQLMADEWERVVRASWR